MIRARRRVIGLIAAASIGAAALALAARSGSPPKLPTRADRPELLLLTSLPLIFAEQFSLEGGGSPALTALERRYRVKPISTTSAAELGKARLLLMAQPRPQAAEYLVSLDRWLRAGGRLLLLADPALEWPSTRPLGDALRPPAMFMDTGLLAHWGLRLDTPEQRGPANGRLAGWAIETVSPGTLHGGCTIGSDRLTAKCRIGRGQVTVVADADLIDGERRGEAAEENLDAVLAALNELDGSDSGESG